ncbi:ComEA family DNA-binding protein [Maridesulfovibrio sp.]|uniref:ComEA family DNA-binding protein n=1 Tax=Maridesulfovibrio sp. TaxID=2795000 RepID=UPI0038B36235
MNKQFKSVRINTANAKTLQQLKGIGPKLAEKIIAYRKCNGPLLGLKDLTKIEGINHTLAKSIAPDISWRTEII